jgi:hypothetical protein
VDIVWYEARTLMGRDELRNSASSNGPPNLPSRKFGGKTVVKRSRTVAPEDASRQWFGVIIGASGMLILLCVGIGLYYLLRESPGDPVIEVAEKESSSDAPDVVGSLGTDVAASPTSADPSPAPANDIFSRFFRKTLEGPAFVPAVPGVPAAVPAGQSVPTSPMSPGVVTGPLTPQPVTLPVGGPVPIEPATADVSEDPGPAIELPPATDYVDLPPLPAAPSVAKDDVPLANLRTSEKCQLRLLGLTEFTSELTWESPNEDPERLHVTAAEKTGSEEREVLGRFRIQDGQLVFRWSHQAGRLRSLQEFVRECVVEVRSEKSEAARYIALRRPTIGKAEGIERLLKDDRRLAIGKALSGVASRRIFLGPMTLASGGQSFESVPLRIPTRENRDATQSKERDRSSKNRKPSRNPKTDPSVPDDDDAMEDDLDDEIPDPEELEQGHFRQQDFPPAAARARLTKLFVEIFPHSDYVILRLDSAPSYVGHFRQMMGAKARISSLNKGIRSQQAVAAKARASADSHMYVAKNAKSGGERGNALASAQRALLDADRAEAKAAQFRSQIPRWEQVGKEAEGHYSRIKGELAEISGGTISGTMYRIVEGIRVDVVRMGNVTAEGLPVNDSAMPDSEITP